MALRMKNTKLSLRFSCISFNSFKGPSYPGGGGGGGGVLRFGSDGGVPLKPPNQYYL